MPYTEHNIQTTSGIGGYQMIDKTTLSVSEYTSEPLNSRKFSGLLDVAAALLPLLALGVIGTRLGAGTLVGAILIALGYVLSITVASVVLKLRGAGWREIGMARPQSWRRTALLGVGTLVISLIVVVAVQVVTLNLPGLVTEPADVSRFDPLEGNLLLLLGYVILAWTMAAFGEEMLFRAFLISQLDRVFQNTRAGWALALMGSSVLFGLAHYQEGLVGVLYNGAFGLVLGSVYLGTRRNLWVTIIAHGLINTLRFVLVFGGAA
jgi:membrane protease YdiL (CAAX protease family)